MDLQLRNRNRDKSQIFEAVPQPFFKSIFLTFWHSRPNKSVLVKYCYENMFLILIKFRLIDWYGIIRITLKPDMYYKYNNHIYLYSHRFFTFYIYLVLPVLANPAKYIFCFRRRSPSERLRQMFTKYCWVLRRRELFSVITHQNVSTSGHPPATVCCKYCQDLPQHYLYNIMLF